MVRGPKLKPGRRTACGRLSKTKADVRAREKIAFDREQKKTMSVAIDARRHIFGMDDDQAHNPLAGTVIGRMRMCNALTEKQYQAAQNYISGLRAYRKAIDAPRDLKAVDLGSLGGVTNVDDDDWTEWVAKAKQRHLAASKAVLACQNQYRLEIKAAAAINSFLINDVHTRSLEGDLRIVLDTLVRFYGL